MALYGVNGDEEVFSYLPLRELAIEEAQYGALPVGEFERSQGRSILGVQARRCRR